MSSCNWNTMVLPTTLRCSILPLPRIPSTSTFPKLLFFPSSHSLLPIPNSSSPSFLSLRRSLSSASMASASQTVAAGNVADDIDIFQRIQSHQEKAARLPPVEEIRTVLANSTRGMLSTFSKKYDGYPSGSMVDFACDVDGTPILAVSSLAVHTQDLLANPKCSLLVAKDPEDRTDLVITLHGDAVAITDKDREAVRTAYLAKHPTAFWVDFGDFQFMKIQPKVVRYVSGVATAVLGSGEFSREDYSAAEVDPISQFSKPIASHMNKDHEEDTRLIVQHSTTIPVDSAYILDVDHLGFNIKASCMGRTYKLRVPFPRPAVDRKDVKTLIVEMLQAAKSTGNKICLYRKKCTQSTESKVAAQSCSELTKITNEVYSNKEECKKDKDKEKYSRFICTKDVDKSQGTTSIRFSASSSCKLLLDL